MVKTIYQFKRDGHEWADYKLHEGATLIRKIDVSTFDAARKAVQTESGRIRALAERAMIENKLEVGDIQIKERGFIGRLKYLIMGE